MMAKDKIEMLNEGTDWETFRIKGKWANWYFGSKDVGNEVEIQCSSDGVDGRNDSIFLDQTELINLITFLQKQII